MPIFDVLFVSAEPTVSAGSASMCATERTSDGSLVGWMSITEPYFLPFRR